MRGPDLADEEFLTAVLAGDIDPGDPTHAARLRTHPALAARLAELRAVASELGAEGALRREALGEPTAVEVAAARRSLELARGVRMDRAARRWPRFALAAAVVAALAVWGALSRWGGERAPRLDPGREYELGPRPPWLLSPAGDLRAGEPLAWDLPLPAGGRFKVSVRDAESGATLLPALELAEATWTPPAAIFGRLPAAIDVRIEALEFDGNSSQARVARLSVSR